MTSQFSTYVITEPCVGVKDATCLEVCPVDCIESTDDENQYFIDPQICIACEQCKLVCPVDAIFLDVEVPIHFRSYTERNAEFYRKTKGEPMPVPIEKALNMIQAGHMPKFVSSNVLHVGQTRRTGDAPRLVRIEGHHKASYLLGGHVAADGSRGQDTAGPVYGGPPHCVTPPQGLELGEPSLRVKVRVVMKPSSVAMAASIAVLPPVTPSAPVISYFTSPSENQLMPP